MKLVGSDQSLSTCLHVLYLHKLFHSMFYGIIFSEFKHKQANSQSACDVKAPTAPPPFLCQTMGSYVTDYYFLTRKTSASHQSVLIRSTSPLTCTLSISLIPLNTHRLCSIHVAKSIMVITMFRVSRGVGNCEEGGS